MSAALQAMVDALEAANGDFVDGRTLAKAGCVPMDRLGDMVAALRKRGLQLEGKNGRGYRIPVEGKPSPAVKRAIKLAPSGKLIGTNTSALDALAIFTPALCEAIRFAALDAGETIEPFVGRLLGYGWEVHRDLVASGERL